MMLDRRQFLQGALGTPPAVAASVRGFRLPTLQEVQTELARRKLIQFMAQGWHVVEHETPFLWGWHIEAICEHLEAVTRGQIRNLLINMPPRHCKSLTVSVFWPMWTWINHPGTKWMYSSYAMQLASRDSVKCRNLIGSPWFQERWGERFQLVEDQNGRHFYVNTRGGYRLAVSVDSAVTGEGGDIIVCDDPHNALEAVTSASAREKAVIWWTESMSTRLNNPRTGRKVIVMQRLHERDLSGVVLESGDYVHLCLPAEYESKRKCITYIEGNKFWEDPRTEEQQPLWDPPYGKTELAQLKKALGTQAAAGQLQQRPAPAEGGLLKRDWWKRYKRAELPDTFDEIVQAWDMAFGGGADASYTVGFVIGKKGSRLYGLGRFRQQVDFPLQLAGIRAMTHSHPLARRKYVEQAANAKAAISTLEKEIPGLIPIPPKGSKLERATAWSPYLEAGNMWLPEDEVWADEMIEECAMFPNGAYADQVDAWGLGAIQLIHSGGHKDIKVNLDGEGVRPSSWTGV